MKQAYTIDIVPHNRLTTEAKKNYGKVWYCHMIGYPDICVGGSVGTKKHAKVVCDLRNLRSPNK